MILMLAGGVNFRAVKIISIKILLDSIGVATKLSKQQRKSALSDTA
jgi:hypothetical protein